MITNFKLFESINIGKPKKDDFVICNVTMENTFTKQSSVDYVNKHIGKIISIQYNRWNNEKKYCVEYSGENNFLIRFNTSIDKIKYWSKDYNDLLPLLKATKYNII